MDMNKLLQEVSYSFVRSSGAGGQHVNKVATKVVLSFSIENSTALNVEEKQMLISKLERRISKEGRLQLRSGATRSQLKNKELVTERFVSLVQQALSIPKKRKPTKRPKSANLKRLQRKKNRAQVKLHRKNRL